VSGKDAMGDVAAATGARLDESNRAEETTAGSSGAAAVEEAGFSLTDGIVESFTALGEGLTGIFSGLGTTLGLDMVGHDTAETAEIVEADRTVFTGMREHFDPYSAYAYLLFVLIYFPCVAAFGTAIQEMGWKYGLVQAAYLTILAWSTATLFYQVTVGHSLTFIVLPVVVMLGVFVLLGLLGREAPKEVSS
jgi:ferrous iron transport protein B